MATQHLLALGHRDIAFIGGDKHNHAAREREKGYLEAIHAAGMRRRSAWVVHHPYKPDAGRRAMHDLCTARKRRPTAVVVANIHAALGALEGARELGLKVPDQLSVVAIHDWWISDYTRPKLTSLRMPQFQMGREAMRMLHQRLSGQPGSDITITDPGPKLIERGSTAPPPRRLVRAQLPENR